VAFAGGNLFVAEVNLGRIRKINAGGTINAVAGTGLQNLAVTTDPEPVPS